MSLNQIRIVLVRPEEAGNVGAAARVLKNFGLKHLVLVQPHLARPKEAYKWAHGSEDVLEGADMVESLEDALAPCVRAWATTRRRGKHRGGFLTPREAAEGMIELGDSGQNVAWVFGPESSGTMAVKLEPARVAAIPLTATESTPAPIDPATVIDSSEVTRSAGGVSMSIDRMTQSLPSQS